MLLSWKAATALRVARSLGRFAPKRSASGRLRLSKLVSRVDRVIPGRGGCYRRALLQSALDRGAAAEKLRVGLVAGANWRAGHIWFPSIESPNGRYDAIFEI